jgi:hypothetical protein
VKEKMTPIEKYVTSAIKRGECFDNEKSPAKSNREFNKNRLALLELRKSADRGEGQLTTLLGHSNCWVRCLAACHLLMTRPEVSVPVLEDLADHAPSSMIKFEAHMVLKYWRKGELKLP